MASTGSNANLNRSQTNLAAAGGFAFEGESKKKGANAAASSVEKKRATLDARHRYLLEKFSPVCDVKPADLENSLLLGNKLDLVNDFFKEGGSKKVLFYWQPSKVTFRT